MRVNMTEELASTIVDAFLTGLAASCWRERYPEAYRALLTYRNDLAMEVFCVGCGLPGGICFDFRPLTLKLN